MARNNEMAYTPPPPPTFSAFPYIMICSAFPPPPHHPQIDIYINLCGQDISFIAHETLK